MFTIDLLKGQGIPAKPGAGNIIIGVIGFAVPVIIGIMLSGIYLSDAVAISLRRQEIARYEKKVEKLSDVVQKQKAFEKKRNSMNSILSEVASSIERHAQWSDVLVTIVKNMPETMVMTSLKAEQDFVTKMKPREDNPQKRDAVKVPKRKLKIMVKGRKDLNYDKAFRDFFSRLRVSKVLSSRLENIRFARNNLGDRKEKDCFYYEVTCLFKEGL